VEPNPFLKKLGFSEDKRVVIIQTDDIGMCQASVQAFKDLWAFDTITSGATMAPCPWVPAVAQLHGDHLQEIKDSRAQKRKTSNK